MKDKLDELRQMRAKAKLGGGEKRIADQHTDDHHLLGAMTDFSPLISNPHMVLLGAAGQIGISLVLLLALATGFFSRVDLLIC